MIICYKIVQPTNKRYTPALTAASISRSGVSISGEKVVSMTASCPAIAADNDSTEVKSTIFTLAAAGKGLELRASTVTLNLRSSNASSTRDPTFPLA